MESFSIIAIRILEGCSPSIKKVLNDGHWYLFNKKYKVVDEKLIKTDSYSIPEDFFSSKINIQAVVGKNGSGKSSVIEIMLRLINNIALRLTMNANTDSNLYFINGLNAELYFLIEKEIHKIKSLDDKLYLDQGAGYVSIGKYLDIQDSTNENTIGDIVPIKAGISILQKFFFTIVNNYSFHSYNACDFYQEIGGNGEYWLNGLFHKNDGYLTPIVLNPFRKFGKIDMLGETNLTNARLASLLWYFKKENVDFIEDYTFNSIRFDLNESYIKEKYLYLPRRKGKALKQKREKVINIRNSSNNIFNSTLKCYFGSKFTENKSLESAYKYLVYKTFSISSKYPNYKSFSSIQITQLNEPCSKSHYEEIKKLVNKILIDTSHITLKIKQTLNFIDNFNNGAIDNLDKIEDKYLNLITDKSKLKGLTPIDKIISSFPPPFYKPTIFLQQTKGDLVKFESMSSGERQFLFYMSTLLYHLKNIDSIVAEKQSVQYKYINIILEEVELYFHPEFQRQFVNKLIKYLELCKYDNIKYFNVIIVTHSPFILSDIPNDNILFLDSGNVKHEGFSLPSFGSNIHDLLKHSFFLDKGLIGDFAISQIKKVLCYLNNDCTQDSCNKDDIQKIINMIGEPLIKERLQSMFNEKHGITEIDRLKKRIEDLEQEIANR